MHLPFENQAAFVAYLGYIEYSSRRQRHTKHETWPTQSHPLAQILAHKQEVRAYINFSLIIQFPPFIPINP